MHFKCNMCPHEFCSGCYNPYKRGEVCSNSVVVAVIVLTYHSFISGVPEPAIYSRLPILPCDMHDSIFNHMASS